MFIYLRHLITDTCAVQMSIVAGETYTCYCLLVPKGLCVHSQGKLQVHQSTTLLYHLMPADADYLIRQFRIWPG